MHDGGGVIHNEWTKLLANALDRASTACVTAGVFERLAFQGKLLSLLSKTGGLGAA